MNNMEPEKCQFCRKLIKAGLMQKHLDYYCLDREFACPLCKKPQTLQGVDEHLAICITMFKQQTQQEAAEESEYCSEYESEEDPEEAQNIVSEKKEIETPKALPHA